MQRQGAVTAMRELIKFRAAGRLQMLRSTAIAITRPRRRAGFNALAVVGGDRRAFSQAVEVTSDELAGEKGSDSSRVLRQLVNGAAKPGAATRAGDSDGKRKTTTMQPITVNKRGKATIAEMAATTAATAAATPVTPVNERRKRASTAATTPHRRRTTARQQVPVNASSTTSSSPSVSSRSSSSSQDPLERSRVAHSSPSATTTCSVDYSYNNPQQQDHQQKRWQQQPRMVFKDGKPLITVMGLGGAGCNAVNNMISSQLEGVEFVVANTDCQALGRSLASRKITLGKEITKGLGAGSKPQLGKVSAEMQQSEIEQCLKDSNMLFITGGMGGGTCTGAAPVVASIAREMGILTVGVVSTPFRSEGPNRTRLANAGVKELSKFVDTLIIVPNQNLLALSNKRTTMLEAFRYADDVLLEGVKGVTDLIVRPGLINLDFADIRTIMSGAGRAIMGSGYSTGLNRAEEAAEKALVNPLLGQLPTESAQGLLVTIRGGEDLTLFEVDKTMEIIRSRVADEANIIFGTCYDQSLEGSIHVSIFVSGIQTDVISPPVMNSAAVSSNPTASTPLSDSHNLEHSSTHSESAEPAAQRGFFSRMFSF